MAGLKSAVPGLRTYQDWRELFEKEGDKIDSVNVSTPDHLHTLIAVTAMRRGKHVYCQKPLCRGLNESKLLFEVAKKSGVPRIVSPAAPRGADGRRPRACHARLGEVARHGAAP